MITRLASKYAFAKKLHMDDLLALIALGFNIASVAAVSVEAESGLGQQIQRLDHSQLVRFSKSEYAAGFFYIATLVCAKTSIVVLLNQISPFESHNAMGLGLGVMIILWGISSIFAQAFQCHLPQTWNSIDAVCFDRAAFWRTFGALNIFTDVALILLPVYMMLGLNMDGKKRAIVISCFGARALDIVVTSVQIAHSGAFNSSNSTFDLVPWTIISQGALCTTIVTSCTPYLRPLLDTLPSGLYDLRHEQRMEDSRDYIMSSDGLYNMR